MIRNSPYKNMFTGKITDKALNEFLIYGYHFTSEKKILFVI